MEASVSKGFSLLEVVVAFAIMSMLASVLLPFASQSIRQTQTAFQKARAASFARNKLEATLAVPGKPSPESGRFNQSFTYRLDVWPKTANGSMGLGLYVIHIQVFWAGKSLSMQTEKLVLEEQR